MLPYRISGKLFFSLCKQCAMDKPTDCGHSTDKRSITGTWVLSEVLKARQQWEKKSSDLFKEYINTFLKAKMEASKVFLGLPANQTWFIIKLYQRKSEHSFGITKVMCYLIFDYVICFIFFLLFIEDHGCFINTQLSICLSRKIRMDFKYLCILNMLNNSVIMLCKHNHIIRFY